MSFSTATGFCPPFIPYAGPPTPRPCLPRLQQPASRLSRDSAAPEGPATNESTERLLDLDSVDNDSRNGVDDGHRDTSNQDADVQRQQSLKHVHFEPDGTFASPFPVADSDGTLEDSSDDLSDDSNPSLKELHNLPESYWNTVAAGVHPRNTLAKEDQSLAQELWEPDDRCSNDESLEPLSEFLGCLSPRLTPPTESPEHVAKRHPQRIDAQDMRTDSDLLLACDNGSPDVTAPKQPDGSEESEQSSIASHEAASSRSSASVEATEASSVDSGARSDDEPLDGAWLVRRVVAQRFRNGRKQYMVDWARTWEDEKDCDCPSLIKEFEQNHLGRKKRCLRRATGDASEEPRVQKRRRVTSR